MQKGGSAPCPRRQNPPLHSKPARNGTHRSHLRRCRPWPLGVQRRRREAVMVARGTTPTCARLRHNGCSLATCVKPTRTWGGQGSPFGARKILQAGIIFAICASRHSPSSGAEGTGPATGRCGVLHWRTRQRRRAVLPYRLDPQLQQDRHGSIRRVRHPLLLRVDVVVRLAAAALRQQAAHRPRAGQQGVELYHLQPDSR